MALRFEPLSKAHDRTTFFSGSLELDRWFRMQAGQDARRGVTRVFVAVDGVGVAGFYTLSMFSVASDSMPTDVTRALPRYPDVPAALIGRLARAERVRGRGFGELLVVDALRRILVAAKDVAAFAIVVDAKDLQAEEFYRRFGFVSFPSRQSRMFLPAATAAKIRTR
jgi:ribosomal protein S18 acetylase RimI-like enzyme